mmetsp:Transcript_35232/g.64002  ORF Transcript_35232/g.64002 Transcript_35232/m.64002 type:complete len:163 (+) Transcript_35232:231-719(+)
MKASPCSLLLPHVAAAAQARSEGWEPQCLSEATLLPPALRKTRRTPQKLVAGPFPLANMVLEMEQASAPTSAGAMLPKVARPSGKPNAPAEVRAAGHFGSAKLITGHFESAVSLAVLAVLALGGGIAVLRVTARHLVEMLATDSRVAAQRAGSGHQGPTVLV